MEVYTPPLQLASPFAHNQNQQRHRVSHQRQAIMPPVSSISCILSIQRSAFHVSVSHPFVSYIGRNSLQTPPICVPSGLRRSRRALLLQHHELSVDGSAATAIQTPAEEQAEDYDEDKGKGNGMRGRHVVSHFAVTLYVDVNVPVAV